MEQTMGVLSPAYFASRSAILAWVNDLVGVNYTKVEQTASGVAACQVFDALLPGQVRLEKVNFAARRDFEFVTNYKVLQAAFSRGGISKQIDVQRLIKGKYQDNLEFMQWVKGYFDMHASEEAAAYDGAARRAELGKTTPFAAAGGGGGGGARARGQAVSATARRGGGGAAAARQGGVRRAPLSGGPTKENQRRLPAAAMVKKAELDAAKAEVAELTQALEDGDRDREFYFGKLRDIEVLVQDVEDATEGGVLEDPVLQQIKDILYKTEEDGGEAAPGDEEGCAEEEGAEGLPLEHGEYVEAEEEYDGEAEFAEEGGHIAAAGAEVAIEG